MRRLILVVLAAFVTLAGVGCRTDRHYAREGTKATLRVFRSYLEALARDRPPDFDPVNFDQFWTYLVEHDFCSAEAVDSRVDGWRRPFKLFVALEGAHRAYLVNSAGRDGTHGTEDDLTLVVDFN